MMMRMSVPMPMYIWRISFSSGTGPSYPGGRVRTRQCGATTPPSGAIGPVLGGPPLHPARHRAGAVARPAEGLRGHERAGADPADEDEGPLAVQRAGALAELRERDVGGAGDVPGLALVGLADVDDLGAAALQRALHVGRCDLERGAVERVGLHGVR